MKLKSEKMENLLKPSQWREWPNSWTVISLHYNQTPYFFIWACPSWVWAQATIYKLHATCYNLQTTCWGRGHLGSKAHLPQRCNPQVYILFLHNLVWQIQKSTWNWTWIFGLGYFGTEFRKIELSYRCRSNWGDSKFVGKYFLREFENSLFQVVEAFRLCNIAFVWADTCRSRSLGLD